MISLFTGNPGGGKSYDVVRNRFIPAFKAGRVIYTNLEGLDLNYICVLEKIEEHYQSNVIELMPFIPADAELIETPEGPFTAEYLPYLNKMDDGPKKDKAVKFMKSRKGLYKLPNGKVVCSMYDFYFNMSSGALAIIDETQNYWSSKDWQNVDISLDYYLSNHRHYGHDVGFITQKHSFVYKQMQRLAEYVWYFEKLSWLGMSKSYKACCSIGIDSKRTYSYSVRFYNKKYFPCYKSYVAKDIKEQNVQQQKLFPFWKIAVVLALIIFFGIRFVNLPWIFGDKEAYAKQMTGKHKKEKPLLNVFEERVGSVGSQGSKKVSSGSKFFSSAPRIIKHDSPGNFNLSDLRNGFKPRKISSDELQVQNAAYPSSVLQKSSMASMGCSGDECYAIIGGEVVRVDKNGGRL